MSRAAKVCKIAMENDELQNYLEGKGRYKQMPDKDSDHDTPNCTTLLSGVHNLYRQEPEEKYIQKFEDTINAMLNGNVDDFIYALKYMGLQMDYETKKLASFELVDDKCLKQLKQTIIQRKDEFEKTKSPTGKTVWEFVEAFDNVNQKTSGRKIL